MMSLSRKPRESFEPFFRGKKEPFETGDRLTYARYGHAFTRDELQEELCAAGFQLADYYNADEWGYAIGIIA